MNIRLLIYIVLLMLTGLLLTGCMVGPKYERPVTEADMNPYYWKNVHSSDVNEGAYFEWWKAFADPVTDEYVQLALEKNYDLEIASARLLQAQAALKESSGALLPQVDYEMVRSRNKNSFNFGGGRFSSLSTTWSQQLSVSYMLDIFGKLRHAKRAAWSDLLASNANAAAMKNAIIANVIIARINISTAQKRLTIAEEVIASRQKTLSIVERKYRRGLVGATDVRLAKENLAAAESVKPMLELTLAKAVHALDELLARRPYSGDAIPDTLPELPELAQLPIGVPASLLDRRPDVRAAEMSLRAANDRVGVSIASLYPDLTLSGAYGRSADEWHDIWISETEIYSALVRLAQPVFRGGQLRARVEQSEAVWKEHAAVYAKTVLTAVREVEDALASEVLIQKQYLLVEKRVQQAKEAERLTRDRYQQGVGELLTVLDTQRRYQAALDELSALKGQLWTTRVNLMLALGGDWTNPEG